MKDLSDLDVSNNASVNISEAATATASRASSSSKAKRSNLVSSSSVRCNRIFKKTSQDGNLVLFLPERDVMITESKVEPLMGVALVHKSVLACQDSKVFLQVVLVFRYGREDEELMGLRFCNEIVIAADQIFPSLASTSTSFADQPAQQPSLPAPVSQQAFLAIPFAVDMGASAPPSVRLLPCRPYAGAPIGTTYEVQLFAGRSPEELPKKRKMVQMSLRLFERIPMEVPNRSMVTLEKNYVFSENNLFVQARLDSGAYSERDHVGVSLHIRRPGGHGVRKLRLSAVQQVSVAMFSTGNFKNSVGSFEQELDPADSCHRATVAMKVELSKDYSWVAMDETAKRDADIKDLAPSVVHANKAMFIIRVHYYVHVLLHFGMLQRDISIKLPFLLKRCDDSMGKKV